MAISQPSRYLPPPPNFWLCDNVYGTSLDVEQCAVAVNQIPRGMDHVSWSRTHQGQFVLPFQRSGGEFNCGNTLV